MIDDVLPPKRQPNPSSRPKMRSERLAGHNSGAANSRLYESYQPSAPQSPEDDKEPQAQAEQSKKRFGKKTILLAILVVFLILGLVSAWYFLVKNQPDASPQPLISTAPKKTEPPKPTTVASPLSGMQVSPELAKRPVTAVMIENSPDSRPQSGLRDAGIIFEAIAEGGITRFATLFQEGQPAYIGPVRSLRPYYIDWVRPFDASVAHVGGSRDALDIIRSPGYKDLDQFFNGSFYSRIKERYAPHNVYTSFDRLSTLNSQKGFTSSNFTPFGRKPEQKLATPTAKTIDLTVSGFYYNANYAYDGVTNTYLRSQAGKPHVDVTSQTDPAPRQLNPKVVIALVMPFSTTKASDGWRTAYGTVGSGQMMVFQDGNVTAGTWSKSDIKSQFVFKNSAGQPILLNPGQTWLTVVDSASDIKYAP